MALDFDGTDDRVDWATVFTTSGQALTVSMWAWFDDATPATTVRYLWVSSPSGGGAGTILYQSTTAAGTLTWFRTGGTSMAHESNASMFSTGVWTHVLGTSDGSLTAANHLIYVNGTEVTYVTASNGATETAANSTWSLGGRALDNNRNFNGRQAEVGVWNRVLGAGEIAALADGHAPHFYPNGLRFYAPLAGRGTEMNRFGAASSTTVGTAYTDHPRIIYPQRGKITLPASNVGRVPRTLAQYRQRRVLV